MLRAVLVFLLILKGWPCSASETAELKMKPWPDPARFESKIKEFETTGPVSTGAILAYGSSSIVGWHKTIQDDLNPLTVIPRGFGGSNMNDAVHFLDRVVLPARPRAVLLYEGDNDVAAGFANDVILDKFREFIRRLHTVLPGTRVYIISVKPSLQRWKFWPQMNALNQQLRALAEAEANVVFIDVATPMLDEGGKPRSDIFLKDKLHMNRKGYQIWRDAVRDVLLERELKEEQHNAEDRRLS